MPRAATELTRSGCSSAMHSASGMSAPTWAPLLPHLQDRRAVQEQDVLARAGLEDPRGQDRIRERQAPAARLDAVLVEQATLGLARMHAWRQGRSVLWGEASGLRSWGEMAATTGP